MRRFLAWVTWCVALACVGALATAGPATEPAVTVTGGVIRGQRLPDPAGAVFKGIPFARPPVGELRWREPAPVVPWRGTRDATAYGAPCAQVAAGWNDGAAAAGHEDCLFLNVWAPEWPPRARRPVMVWIHGGANMGGSSLGAGGIEPPFDGERLARHGVVVVTTNYRLGLFGFFVHPELVAESPRRAAGNYGILDQVAALKWVRANIAAFGGDASNVTIFGQSAGAHDIGLLMVSPLARGLFHRAIAQSGTVIIRGELTPPRTRKEQAGVALAERLGAPTAGALAFLRALPTTEVLKASPSYGSGGELRPEPTIDGYAITELPAAVFRAGKAAPVPLIIGNNGRERSLDGGPGALQKAITDFYGPLAPGVLALYGIGGDPSPPYQPYGDANAQFATDTAFRCGAALVAAWHGAKSPTFQYEFTRGREPRGAVHSLELRYVFGFLTPQEADVVDRTISDAMQDYWTSFAKSGTPQATALPDWPRWDGARRQYLEFGIDGPLVRSRLREAACAAFTTKVEQAIRQE